MPVDPLLEIERHLPQHLGGVEVLYSLSELGSLE